MGGALRILEAGDPSYILFHGSPRRKNRRQGQRVSLYWPRKMDLLSPGLKEGFGRSEGVCGAQGREIVEEGVAGEDHDGSNPIEGNEFQ
jgi:hypothetical protein